MNSRLNSYMRRSSFLAAAAAMVVTLGGCDLDVENPNAPDARRAFSDPAGSQQLIGGAFRTWVETRGDYYGALPMTAMADSYTASWNNAAIRFYSSVGSDCPSRCGWTNSATAPEAAGGPSVEYQWYGYNTVLSSANTVLKAIADGVCFDDNCATDNTLTSRNKAIAKMLQGMAMAGISMLYDQGFIVDETTDLSNPSALPFATRAAMRDAAIASFDAAYTEAGLKTWSTPSEWMGVGSGRSYTNTQIRQLIRTMQAEVLAMHARNDTENAATNWTQVATFASQGISSGTPFDFEFFIDASGRECGLDCVKTWGNSNQTMRVDTRLAAKFTNHVSPWPEAAGGNPCPYVADFPDRRIGDGTWGPTDDFNGAQTVAATANAGTDFYCAGSAIFPAARGQYHQSNMGHKRFDYLAYRGENGPAQDATGQDPFYTRWMNDLLWAEAEMRRAGGSPAVIAARLNSSRVGRGNLPAVTGAEGNATLLPILYYEQDIEFMGQGPTPFFNVRRRAPSCANPCTGVEGLINGTPRHMPVPAKELDVLQRAVYTFGGSGAAQIRALDPGAPNRKHVSEIWEDYMKWRRSLGNVKH